MRAGQYRRGLRCSAAPTGEKSKSELLKQAQDFGPDMLSNFGVGNATQLAFHERRITLR
jgi:hypothetical protein